jgi:sorbitol/mannitol transport system permease protein
MSAAVADAPRSSSTPSAPSSSSTRSVRKSARRRRPKGQRTGHLLSVLAWAAGLIFFAPVAWMVLTSFKQEAQAATSTPTFFFTPTLDQYTAILGTAGAGSYLLNSVIATVASTLLVLVLAVPAAYAVSIRPVEKTQDVLFFFISTKMLPVVAVIMPIYVIAGQIRMLDNILTLIVLYTAMNLPIAVWMMRSFFLEVPGEVLEAASIDGASLRRTMRTVLLPMVAPGMAATALICVIFAWNEFFFALNLTAANAATVPIFLMSTMTSEGQFLARLSAASVLASLPVVLAGWIAQKQLVRGLSMGAVK